jgi:hypothetical protein
MIVAVVEFAWSGLLTDPIIPTPWSDVLRVVNGASALVLVVAACYAVMVSSHSDQRVRFGLFALFAVLLTTGHLSALGEPAAWRLPVLTLAVLAAIWSTVKFVRRRLALKAAGLPDGTEDA